MLAGCCSMCCDCQCSSAEQPNISVFAHYIRNTAKQQGITLAEAADKLYDLGVRGFDVGPDDKDLPELAATKLKPINFYFFPKMLGASWAVWNDNSFRGDTGLTDYDQIGRAHV